LPQGSSPRVNSQTTVRYWRWCSRGLDVAKCRDHDGVAEQKRSWYIDLKPAVLKLPEAWTRPRAVALTLLPSWRVEAGRCQCTRKGIGDKRSRQLQYSPAGGVARRSLNVRPFSQVAGAVPQFSEASLRMGFRAHRVPARERKQRTGLGRPPGAGLANCRAIASSQVQRRVRIDASTLLKTTTDVREENRYARCSGAGSTCD
jgi:hypothetical protein